MVHGLETLREINDRAVADAAAQPKSAIDVWAIVEVMGHNRFVGKMTEYVIAGQGFIRVDVPDESGGIAFTKLLGPSSIYAISPIDEATARSLAAGMNQAPVQAYELKRLGSTTRDAGASYSPGDDADDDEDGGVDADGPF